jgi:hypothetical protein
MGTGLPQRPLNLCAPDQANRRRAYLHDHFPTIVQANANDGGKMACREQDVVDRVAQPAPTPRIES